MTLERAFAVFGPGRRFFVERRGLFLAEGGGFEPFSCETAAFLTHRAAETLSRHYGGEIRSAIVDKSSAVLAQ